MATERNHRFPNFWLALLTVAAVLGLEVVIANLFLAFGADIGAGDPKYLGVISVLAFGIGISLLMGYRNINYRQLFYPAGPIAPGLLPRLLLPLLLVAWAVLLLGGEANLLVLQLAPMSAEDAKPFVQLAGSGVVSVITLCVVAPFVEEMFFRGLLLRSFMFQYRPTTAIALSALIFALAHANLYQFVGPLFLGLLSGWLYVNSRSLWPSVLVHGTYNGLVVLMVSASDLASVKPDEMTRAQPVSLLSVLLAGLMLFGGMKMIRLVLARYAGR